jgi:predicted lipoprotein with Yx(FWY)xxD motif
MSRSEGRAGRISLRARRPRRSSGRALRIAAIAAGAAFVLAGLAFAANGAPQLSSSANAPLGKMIVVDAHGRTVYALSPETDHHLLCRSSACLAVWHPVPGRSQRVTVMGVVGRARVLRRGSSRLQVTLRGMPLYTFAGDNAKGKANGEGIKSFGGTWHVVPATVTQAMTPAPAPPAPSAPLPGYTPPPGY